MGRKYRIILRIFLSRTHDLLLDGLFGDGEWLGDSLMTGFGNQDFLLWTILGTSGILFDGADNILV